MSVFGTYPFLQKLLLTVATKGFSRALAKVLLSRFSHDIGLSNASFAWLNRCRRLAKDIPACLINFLDRL